MAHAVGMMTCVLMALAAPDPATDPAIGVRRLVRQLDDDDLSRREQAEQQLIDLGPVALKHLPPIQRQLSPEVKARLARVRNRLQRDAAKAATRASTVTLRGEMRLSQALASLQQQTGNQLVDYRRRFGQAESDPAVRCQFDQQPYWSVVDQLLDQAQLQLYSYSGTPHTLAIVRRDPDRLPTRGRVSYEGLFRFEATRVEATRDLRTADNAGLKVTLEIAWEPRIQPISLTQPLAALTASDEKGRRMATDNRQAKLEVAAQNTVAAIEMDIPLKCPPRSVNRIASLRGTIDVVLPGRTVPFRFEDLADAKNVEQQNAGVTVVLQTVRRNLDVHDVRILVRFERASGALESHRGWVFNNRAYLVDGDGDRIEHAGLETTTQQPNEIGLSYKFVIDKPLKEYTFVYETAAAIVRVPIEYQLRNIDLP